MISSHNVIVTLTQRSAKLRSDLAILACLELLACASWRPGLLVPTSVLQEWISSHYYSAEPWLSIIYISLYYELYVISLAKLSVSVTQYMIIVTRYTVYPVSSISKYSFTYEEKGFIQYDKCDLKAERTVFEIRWIWAVSRAITDKFTDFSSIVSERKIISNFIFELLFDILKMIYYLVLEKEYKVLLFRLGHARFSIIYALGSGILDAQWHNMNDVDMKRMLKNEKYRYRAPYTGVNLNKMNYSVYNLRGVRLCMASRVIYNTALCYFFNINLFRCLDFADLKDFLYYIRHVHMIQRIQIAWKDSRTPITKRIRRLQKTVIELAELRFIVEKKDSEVILI